jgi:hypothetical protein
LPPSGDFDVDGDVDGSDFLTWQQGLGTASGATRQQGDADGDGVVSGSDLAVWRLQFGQMATAAAVPEPATAALALGVTLIAHRRSRKCQATDHQK